MSAPPGQADPELRARLAHLPRTATQAGRTAILTEILTDYGFLAAKVRYVGIRELTEDYDRAFADLDLPPAAVAAISEIRSALRSATPVVLRDWTQLASQLVGLLDAAGSGTVAALVTQARAWRERPWLEPVRPTLRHGGQSAQLVGLTAGPIVGLAALGTARCAALSPYGVTRVWDLRATPRGAASCPMPTTSQAFQRGGRGLAALGSGTIHEVYGGVLTGC